MSSVLYVGNVQVNDFQEDSKSAVNVEYVQNYVNDENNIFPLQIGNTGKFLRTNGNFTSWDILSSPGTAQVVENNSMSQIVQDQVCLYLIHNALNTSVNITEFVSVGLVNSAIILEIVPAPSVSDISGMYCLPIIPTSTSAAFLSIYYFN